MPEGQKTFIQHPSDIALDYTLNAPNNQLCLELDGMPKQGGLSFKANEPIALGSIVNIKIAPTRPILKVKGIITVCEEQDSQYEIGVEFLNGEDAYKVRMMEQVCHIEQYKNNLQREQGKRVSREAAAMKWIADCGATFPNPQ